MNQLQEDEEWGWFIVIDEDYTNNNKININNKNNTDINKYNYINEESFNSPQKYYITSLLVYIMSLFMTI
jgi:hypothetical protein